VPPFPLPPNQEMLSGFPYLLLLGYLLGTKVYIVSIMRNNMWLKYLSSKHFAIPIKNAKFVESNKNEYEH
jgi:hypothetical protein